MFARSYEKITLGRRIALVLARTMVRRTLTVGYAVAMADLLLAPFTPSVTARSARTVFPMIRNLPALYGSHPNDPSAPHRRLPELGGDCGHFNHQPDVPDGAPAQLARGQDGHPDRQNLHHVDRLVRRLRPGWYRAAAGRVPVLSTAGQKRRRGAGWARAELGKLGCLRLREDPLAVLVLFALAL